MLTSANVDASPASNADTDDEDLSPLRCWECNVNFTERRYLYAHLFHHVRQPYIIVERCTLPPLKITLLKSNSGFEIISNGRSDSASDSTSNLAELREEAAEEESGHSGSEGVQDKVDDAYLNSDFPDPTVDDQAIVRFSPDFANVEEPELADTASNASSSLTETTDSLSLPIGGSSETTATIQELDGSGGTPNSEYGASIPGAEPTPPPEPSPDYPKIRIKTTGLLKEPLTITEITDDNPNGDPNFNHNGSSNMWTSLEDPLKLPENHGSDDGILALFNGSDNNRAKDLGFHSTDSEFISLDRLEERNRGTMTLYNPSAAQSSQNPLDQLTGLPMQALAQQVSRLQPSSGSGQMHQQNVLINIQQFPSGPPPQPSYQPPPMYGHHYPPQPMHQPYQYQPPNPMYYPPAPPGYPPQPHMPPPPQMPPISQPHGPQMGGQPQQGITGQGPQPMPPTSQHQQPGQNQQGPPPPGQQYRPHAPRQPGPRPPAPPGPRMPAGGPRQPMGQRQPVPRARAPMVRPRGGGPMTASRGGIRPRMPGPPNGVRQQQSPIKRSPEQIQQMQAKKKKFDLLTPDKDDDDCQVICMQPKNSDGLPQIESVQGGTPEPSENSIMHLSDSITLSVRNPPPKPAVVEPKKSDAKAVANILATRGITVTATAKPKEKESPTKSASPNLPASLNLNGAVSIIPSKNGAPAASKPAEPALPTVDLTDETPTSAAQKQRPGLPYRCDLCPATYPNANGLNRHRQTYHKTSAGMCELGIPLVNMKNPGAMQKLASLGIFNYVPLPSSGADGTFAMPVINSRNPGNVSALGATTMLSLGPIRTIQRPQNAPNTPSPVKPANQAK